MKYVFIYLLVLVSFLLTSCTEKVATTAGVNIGAGEGYNQIKVNCDHVESPDYSNLALLENLDENTALTRVTNYLTYSKCHRKFPSNSTLKAYYFTPEMLGTHYTFIQFSGGFNKQPASIKVRSDSGMELLFCFNKMVINCNRANCVCPYDFNHEPKKLSPDQK